jgi:hypothetical protein
MIKDNWPRLMNQAIESVLDKPFEWGKHDCCLFAAGVVEAMTGEDPMAEFRGKYHDQESALKALKKIGSGSLYHTMRAKFGNPRRPRRGDVVYHTFDTGPTLGICVGANSVFVGEEGNHEGLVILPTAEMKRGFWVG